MNKPISIDIQIISCQIVRDIRDNVYFELAKVDQFNRELEYSNIHGEYEKYNDRSLRIGTVSGNGPNIARKLGHYGKIEIIETKSGKRKLIESWDFDNKEKEI